MKLNDPFSALMFPAFLLGLFSVPFAAHSQDSETQGRGIEFSSSGSRGTNLFNQFFPGNSSGAGSLDDVFQVPQAMVPVGSLNGVAIPRQTMPQSSAVQSSRLKLLQEKNYWFLGTDADPLSGTTAEEIFGLPQYDANGRDLDKLSPVERYLVNQAAKKQEAMDKAKIESQQKDAADSIYGIQRLLDTANGELSGTDSSLSPGVPAIFAPQSGSAYSGRAFGQNDYSPKPTDADLAQKARLEEFNKMIGMTEADNLQTSPLTSSLNSGSPNSIGKDWNPFSSAYQAPAPKKSPLPGISTPIAAAVEKPAKPAATEPATASLDKEYQPLFAPAFTMPRRRVQ